jgi:hypothetical protein
MLQLPAGREAGRAERVPQYERHRPAQTLLFQGSIPAQPVSMLLHCADATGYRLAWRHELAGERVKERELSGQRGQIGRGFGMIRLESSGSDCTMGSGLRENGVNSAYTPSGMSVDAVIDFLESRGKFVARDVGFNTAKDKICNH